MASEDTLIGNDFVLQLGDDSSPPIFTDFCAAFDFGAVGEEKPLVETTAYCDAARTYRNGLADGKELSIQCNFISNDPQLESLYLDYQNDVIRPFRILVKNSSPVEHFTFESTVRAWELSGPIGERSVLTFTVKVSGGVLWTQP